jgi:membrane protein
LSTATDSPPVGRPPGSPTRLSAREWWSALKRTFKEFLADDGMGLAQQVAFSSLLAFIPAVVLLVGLLGIFNAYDDLERLLRPVAPGAVLDTIKVARDSAQGNGGSVIAVVVGTVLAVWAASGATNAIVKAVNRAYGRQETRPFWMVRIIAIVLVLLTGATTAGIFVLIVFGGPLGEAIANRADLGSQFTLVWDLLRWPIAFLAILLFFAFVYYLAPDIRPRNWKWISPGSVVGGLMWLALSGLFALYTSFSGSYDRTYGSLAGAIILLLWLQYSAVALLFGAELNASLEREADIKAAGGKDAGLIKPVRRTSSS